MSRIKIALASCCGLAMIFAIMALTGAVAAFAQTEHVLHNFSGGQDGSEAGVNLVADKAGNLYSVTADGGGIGIGCFGTGCGTVFEMSPPAIAGGKWTEKVLYGFKNVNASDGARPGSPLVIDNAGNLYGSTGQGGTSGYGIVFELSPPAGGGNAWTETILYNLAANEVIAQRTPLLLDAAGNLYGESSGWPNANGSIFELSPPAIPGDPWTYTLLYTFPIDGLMGSYPQGGLVPDDEGNVYGVGYASGNSTCTVGSAGCGVVFELAKPPAPGGSWTYSVIHQFTGTEGDGLNPSAITIHKGAIYGTTAHGGVNGGGTVFKLSLPGNNGGEAEETTLYAFSTANTYGSWPQWGVTFDRSGNLYTTTSGEDNILELSPPTVPGSGWTPRNIYTFPPPVLDISGVMFGPGGVLYGASLNGGPKNLGFVFGIVP